MAGESPDRSKQRESSAEPTPGSAGPVPEARDPRLAVSREKDSAPGVVDTATKVLSVRDVKTPAPEASSEDTALREAVSSWVRAAAPATPGPTPADEPTAEETGSEETGTEETGTGAESPDADAKTNTATEPDADAPADKAPDADAETEAAPDADEKADPANESDENADTEATAEESSEAETEADADRDAEAEAEAEADDNAGAKADAKAKAGEGEAEAVVAEDGPEDADGEDAPQGPPAAGDETRTGGAGGNDTDAEGEAEAGDEPAPTPEAKAGEGEAEAVVAEDGPEDADGEDAPQGPPAAGDETRTGGAGGNDTDAEGEAEAGDEPAPTPEAKAGEGEAEAVVAEDGPEDADGEDAPQGPPAADDETRTGGAGGNDTDAEGEAEAGDEPAPTPEAKAGVDQPTTVFKAVTPKPRVDQPTTMLKLGGKKSPESDSERTSKFVALKNDVAPAAKPDATTPVPQVGPERTTQQPLPPKPPLDLLAELTNTPPPPETAVRTLVRRVKIWTPLVLLLAIIFAVVQTLRPLPDPTLDLTAKDSYTFDGGKADIPWPASGQAALDVQGIGTFGSSGAQKPVPIASVAKVMTAYLILRDHPLKSGQDGPKITIDKPAQDQSDAGQESTVRVTAGDRISEREALEAILLPSANNVARLLARWDSHSEQAFTVKMNAAAKSLGMTDTKYTDPSGLTASTVSTAVDQVKLARAAMRQPVFREVAAMMSYDDYKGVNHSNYNRLVGHNNVVGIKTGTSTAALGNLVFAAKQQVGGETRTIIGAVLRQPAGGFDNTIISGVLDAGDKLIRAAQGALKPVTILKKGDLVGYVDDGLGGRTPVVATKDVTAVGWSGLKVKLSFTHGKVPHTAKAGTEVGSLTVGDGSAAGAVKVPVALQEDLAQPGFGAKLTRLG
ncbi:D-alanyl-D-alanine carboxypeptidase [Streptomyces puniciscabiei]|uniref:D-alanyl-D-alanine carboxypeptidase n=1 Tax=Streptomyces puniciscabiei TaxID=164348 RepID=UPI001FCC631C|nr:D-alanyl-D-alanine carboxypeptidase [Streptomyces puniciscabiei]